MKVNSREIFCIHSFAKVNSREIQKFQKDSRDYGKIPGFLKDSRNSGKIPRIQKDSRDSGRIPGFYKDYVWKDSGEPDFENISGIPIIFWNFGKKRDSDKIPGRFQGF